MGWGITVKVSMAFGVRVEGEDDEGEGGGRDDDWAVVAGARERVTVCVYVCVFGLQGGYW